MDRLRLACGAAQTGGSGRPQSPRLDDRLCGDAAKRCASCPNPLYLQGKRMAPAPRPAFTCFTPRMKSPLLSPSIPSAPLPLYSTKAIRGFSVFFSAVAGGVLLAQNLKDLGRPAAALTALWGSIGYTVLAAVLVSYLPAQSGGGSFGIGVGLLGPDRLLCPAGARPRRVPRQRHSQALADLLARVRPRARARALSAA